MYSVVVTYGAYNKTVFKYLINNIMLGLKSHI